MALSFEEYVDRRKKREDEAGSGKLSFEQYVSQPRQSYVVPQADDTMMQLAREKVDQDLFPERTSTARRDNHDVLHDLYKDPGSSTTRRNANTLSMINDVIMGDVRNIPSRIRDYADARRELRSTYTMSDASAGEAYNRRQNEAARSKIEEQIKAVEEEQKNAKTTAAQYRARTGGLTNPSAAADAREELDAATSRLEELDAQKKDLMDQLHAVGGKHGVLDFVGDALDALQGGLQTPLSTQDKANYWISKKLGLIDEEDDPYEYETAHALENDIAQTTERAKEGRNKLGQTAIGAFESAGNVLGSTAFAYATGIPQAAQQFIAPVAADLSATEAALGAGAGEKARSAANRFAGNLIGDVVGSPTNFAISAQSGIGAYDRAKTAGASDNDAFAAALGNAAAEYFSNKLFSGTPLEDSPEEKGYVVELIEEAARRAGNSAKFERLFGNGLVNFVFDKAGEGLEEVVTGVFDPLIEHLTYNPDADIATAGELLEEFAGGVAMSLLLGAGEPFTKFQAQKAEARQNRALDAMMNAGMRGQSYEEAAEQYRRDLRGMNADELRAAHDFGAQVLGYAKEENRESNRPLTNEQMIRMFAEDSNMGENGKYIAGELFSRTRTESDSVSDFFPGFLAAYNAGREGRALESITVPDARKLTQNELSVAYSAGQDDAVIAAKTQQKSAPAAKMQQSAFEYSIEQNQNGNYDVVVKNSAGEEQYRGGNYADRAIADSVVEEYKARTEGASENVQQSDYADQSRDAGIPAGERGGELRRRAEETGQRRAAREREAESIRAAVLAQAPEAVSARSIGIEGGTESAALRIVPQSLYTEEMRAVQRQQRQAGRNVVYFTGEIEYLRDGKTFTARGAISNDGKTMYIAADHAGADVAQIAAHEEYHARVQNDPELNEQVRDTILRHYDDAQLQELVDAYVDAYGWGEWDAERVLEEILADAYAGIDVFDYLSTYEGATRYTAEAQQAVSEREGEQQGERSTPAGEMKFSMIGRNSFGDEVYETSKELKNMSYAEKISRFKENFYREDSPHYIGQKIRFQTKNGYYFAEIDRQTQRENTKKLNPGRLMKTDKAKINVGAEGDFVTLLENSRLDSEGNAITKRNNDAKKRAVSMDYHLKNVVIDGTPYEVVINVTAKDGNHYVYDVELKRNKNRPLNDPQLTEIVGERRSPGNKSPNRSRETKIADGNGIVKEEFSSTFSEAALQRQNEELRRRVEYWKGQTQRTTQPTVRQSDVDAAAKELIKEYSGTVKAQEITPGVKALAEYIMRGEGLTWSGVKEKAVEIARTISNSASALRDGDGDTYSELRSAMRKPMIISAQDAHDVSPEWGAWRNANVGKANVSINGKGTPVDTVYAELAERFPGLFPESITHPADQLQHMIDVLDNLAPIYENPYSYNTAEAIEYCANDIIDRVLGEDIRQTPPTFADRAAARLAEEKARGAQKAAQVREQKNAQIADLKARNAWAAAQAIAKERKARDAKIQALKDHYAEARKTASERKADSAARTRLLKIAKRLQNKKLPAVSRALLNQYIGELDTVAKSITDSSIENLSALRDWYDDQKANNPDFIADAATEAKIARLGKTQISDLTPTQVAELTEVLLNFEHEINSQRKLIESEDRRDTRQMVLESIYNVEETKGSKKTLLDWLATNTLSPIRLMKRLTGYNETDPLLNRTQELADGQRRMLDYQMRAEARFKKWAGDEKLMTRLRKKERIKISGYADGRAVSAEITPDMRMALYLHSLNDENMKHIANGGITIPDIDLYLKGDLKEAYSRGKTIKLSPSNVRSIAAGMSAEERAYAQAAHDYFNGMSKEEINAVSEKLVGYSIAGVDDYFPIETDRNFTKSDIDELKRDGTIEGMGFLKERQHASNAINLVPLTDVLNRSIKNHAKYVGLAIAVRNFGKVWGMNAYNDAAGESHGLRQAVSNKWGSRGVEAVENMISDLQNAYVKSDDLDKFFSQIKSNYAGAVLTLNASVAMKQAASYPTAAAVLGWGPLAKAMKDVGRVDLDLIAKYTPLQWYRSQGYSTQELGDIKSRQGMMDKLMKTKVTVNGYDVPLFNWIQSVDLLTTRKLWKASEYYVRDRNPELRRGSNEYYQAVADIYNRTIEETQPNYTAMQRPQLLRSHSAWAEILGMFKTQPFQNFNILYDAMGELAAAERMAKNGDRSKLKLARKNAALAVESQLAQLAVFAAMTMAWGLLRRRDDKWRDKDGNLTVGSMATGIGKDMIGGAFSMIPGGADVYNLMESMITGGKYYGASSVTVSAISDAGTAIYKAGTAVSKAISKLQEGEGVDYKSLGKTMENLALEVSKVFGVPAENVRNNIEIIMAGILRQSEGKYVGGYTMLRLTENMESSYVKGDAYDLLFSAYQHDRTEYNRLRKMMIKDGFTEKNIDAAMKKRRG